MPRYLSDGKRDYGGREGMDLVEPADRTQLALTKCPRQWYIK